MHSCFCSHVTRRHRNVIESSVIIQHSSQCDLLCFLWFRCVWSGWKACQSVCEHMASQLQFGRLRGLRAKVLRRYEHRPLVSCLSGLYGCRWRRYERSCTEPGECCCNKVRPASSTRSAPVSNQSCNSNAENTQLRLSLTNHLIGKWLNKSIKQNTLWSFWPVVDLWCSVLFMFSCVGDGIYAHLQIVSQETHRKNNTASVL